MGSGLNKLEKSTYPNTEVIKKLTGNKLFRVVVLVRWKQFTQEFSVDVRDCSQIIGETRRDF